MAQKYTLPELPYDYAALQPVISAEIMQLHHQKHHQAYVNNLNAALEKYAQAEAQNDISAMIGQQSAIRFNGGGHINHSIFWTNLAPTDKGGGAPPAGELMAQIKKQWGSLEALIEKFNAQTVGIQGSGWGWLAYAPENKIITIATTANQDPLHPTQGLVPLLGIDVWEHAYYLQYKNVRADYLKSIWKIVSWSNVNERFEKACQLSSSHK